MAQTIREKPTPAIIGRSTAFRFRSFWRRKYFRWVERAPGLWDSPVPPERIIIEQVVVNPKFEESLFSTRQIGVASNVR